MAQQDALGGADLLGALATLGVVEGDDEVAPGGGLQAAGDFAFYVGLPAKSGVAGGIAAVVPNVMGICVWSPGLDEKGNSLLGRYALHRFTRMTGLSVF